MPACLGKPASNSGVHVCILGAFPQYRDHLWCWLSVAEGTADGHRSMGKIKDREAKKKAAHVFS